MTTTVIVKAHCAATKEVHVNRKSEHSEDPTVVLQDGQEHSCVVYDSLSVEVKEVEKKTA
ncbi:MAG TPA: hypothetical protein VF450_26400 [Noviherbaspirillum sp.]